MLIFFLLPVACAHPQNQLPANGIHTGAECTSQYFELLKGKNIAVVANQTSLIGKTHLVDSLLHAGFAVTKVFAPEHGFRGNAQAGEKVNNSLDGKTGLPIVSLYGKHLKPTAEDLKDIDLVIFDIQDVGARFYTFSSTLTYVMEACAENDVELLVLDRPNPNGFYVDGPVLDTAYRSFVGLHPVPIVHGLTIAEYALMINGEGWLHGGKKCRLRYVAIENYTHSMQYVLPINPSPNLSCPEAVLLYPSLCLFEGTNVSVGRGTSASFTMIGHPDYPKKDFCFTPKGDPKTTYAPLYDGVSCFGLNLRDSAEKFRTRTACLYLGWLINMYKILPDNKLFFNTFFDKLAGSPRLREQIIKGLSEEEIRKSWQSDLEKYKAKRKKYLLYSE
ncbi:MAG: DUF1343 domain-containing protein [Lentimicrobiaceae bacterium]|nr:DUF1343 domain-containing protein [Lentimicrobiaceae bacterium]